MNGWVDVLTMSVIVVLQLVLLARRRIGTGPVANVLLLLLLVLNVVFFITRHVGG